MLTLGQQRIRAIVREYADAYSNFRDLPSNGREWNGVAESLVSRFKGESVIVHDIVTGQILQRSIPKRYVTWRSNLKRFDASPVISLEQYTSEIRFDRFHYINAVGRGAAFEGGAKPHTVAKALCSLAFESDDFRIGVDAQHYYYSKAGILSAQSGSNHRQLACVLWGKVAVSPDVLVVLESRDDYPQLREALRILDWLQSPGEVQLSAAPEAESVEPHIDLLLSLSASERLAIQKNLSGCLEKNLTLVLETVEMQRQLKRQWLPFVRWWTRFHAPSHIQRCLVMLERKATDA
jgi:hypothetical protein